MTRHSTTSSGVEGTVARPGGVSYLRMPARDIAEPAEFYRAVFGWRLRGAPQAPSFSDGTGTSSGTGAPACPPPARPACSRTST